MGSFAEPAKADATVLVSLTNQPELKFPRAILLMLTHKINKPLALLASHVSCFVGISQNLIPAVQKPAAFHGEP